MKKVILLIAAFLMVFGLSACQTEEATIVIYTRDTTSGTRAGFMGGIGFDEAAESNDVLAEGFVINDNTGIFTAMQTDENGIGYVSLATYESDSDAVKGLSFEGVAPSTANVVNNTYGLKRPFNYVTRAWDDYATDAEKEIVEAFIAFLATTDGADIITNQKGVALPSTESWDDIKDQHTICDADNSAITIKFGGSDSIQKIAEALSEDFAPKCGNFVPEHDHTGSSDGYKRTQGSEKDGDNYKHIGFASRPFKTDGSEGTALAQDELDQDTTRGQLAWDAIVAIVHNDNELDNASAALLKKIFEGTYTTWSAVLEANE
jgi:phosphate transport system substrate-binding protein